jgi:hypothetical protein
MATNDKKSATVTTLEKRNSKDSLSPEVKTPRIARFAEATSVYSPIDPPRSPLSYPTNHYKPQPQVSDVGNVGNVGFGYVQSVEMEETDRKYLPPPTPKTPLRSALKSPGAPPRTTETMILSPTFREEQVLEKHEEMTEKEQQKDLVRSLLNESTCALLTVSRKSKYEYEWQRYSYEASTSPAVSSFCLCSQPPLPSSTPPRHLLPGTTSRHGPPTRRSGRKCCFCPLPASH